MTTRSRRPTKQEQEAAERQSGLKSWLGRPSKEKPPRFAVRSLSDEELARELRKAEDGAWKEALRGERQRRRKR